ncbi:type VI secretion system baseplate subunit TssG [Chitinolyticbacter meiyuanensis]|uniref:type VI secretion system baseplate subunit TssG n=1 Tax=Chitinolyticbacter meiyuanensis TaxID=682798 RepID=UPI0011E5CCD8|nr:type VI secretion system baseplate subunit TssG [Chitinolyticbacter meiyuanensis]
MAAADWRTARPLKTALADEFGRFNIFQLVRLLRWQPRARGANGTLQPLKPWAIDERLRFRGELSAAFPGREVTRVVNRRRPRRPVAQAPELIELTTPNYCVAGELGPLPEPYTEWVRDELRAGEPAMAAFLDLFNHRTNALRHQIKARQEVGLNHLEPAETRYAQYLGALMGVGLPELAAQLPLPARAWLGLAGLLANCRKSATTVEHVLSRYLGVPVALTQLIGAWRNIERGDRQLLGRHGNRLGRDCLVGGRYWDQQARIRLTVATLDYARFRALLPLSRQENGYAAFAALVHLLVDRRVDVEVVLRLDTPTAPRATLNREEGGSAMRLSQTAWLSSADAAADAAARAVTFLIPAYPAKGDGR